MKSRIISYWPVKSNHSGVILVGHSSAGFLLQAAAPEAPEKIERLVFHNAFLLPNGMSQFDLVPPEVAQGMTAMAEASPDQSVPVIEDFVRGALLADEPKGVQDDLMARLVPQPLVIFTTKVNTRPFQDLKIPMTYLFCKDDKTPAPYMDMANSLPGADLVQIDGGHETLWTNPEYLAESLIRIAG